MKETTARTPIGGYFELDVGTIAKRNKEEIPAFPEDAASKTCRIETPYRLQSARAAFHVILKSVAPERVWVPSYLCDAMLSPLRSLGIDYVFYGLGCDLAPLPVALQKDDVILVVDYFGVCASQVQTAIDRHGSGKVIVDQSQAFFQPSPTALATICSTRKFFGVGDGGLLFTDIPICLPDAVDLVSPSRYEHLLLRLCSSPQAGYAAYHRAENSLEDDTPRRMSPLTTAILDACDTMKAKATRTENFQQLAVALGAINELVIKGPIEGPMAYPFLNSRAKKIRVRLGDDQIFAATYWNDVLKRVRPDSWEAYLVECLIPLPCDQRYKADDMKRIIQAITTQ